jgi:hypothetical protein
MATVEAAEARPRRDYVRRALVGLVLLPLLVVACGSGSSSISVRGPLEHRQYPGGRGTWIASLTVDPRDSDTVYAAVPGECRIFKSIDGGRSWRNVGLVGPRNPLHDQDSQCVYDVWTRRRNDLYASTLDNAYTFKSSDAARSWQKVSDVAEVDPQDSQSVGRAPFTGSEIARDPQDTSVIYAGTSKRYLGHRGGVFRSADGGRSWRWMALAGRAVDGLAIARDGKALYASTTEGAVIRLRLAR